MKIQDPKGVWLINQGSFRFSDGENGTIFEPGEPTKALRTQWVKDQTVIVRCVDPTQENGEEAQAELDKLNAQDAQERYDRLTAAEAVMAEDNNKLLVDNAEVVSKSKSKAKAATAE
jgi:hypothetical protein